MSISDISYILDGIDGLSDDSRDIKKNFAFLLLFNFLAEVFKYFKGMLFFKVIL